MFSIKESSINELKKFCKENFDKDKIFSTAEELKYSSLISYSPAEFEKPSEDFVRFILTNIYEGQKNQRIIEKFTPVVKKLSLPSLTKLLIIKSLLHYQRMLKR